ncbi:MAG: flavin reductase family protein [Thermoleophilia bacterium]|jgi:flavin reductase (DIM6/NTAB) family NADH-FMN oxidoreductase RutF
MSALSHESRAFRDTVGAFATGVTIVTTQHGGAPQGMTLNSFTSVSLDPLLVLVSLAHGTRTLDGVKSSKKMAVNVLHRTQQEAALAFAKRGGEFPTEHAVLDPHGFYSVRHSLAIMRCEIFDIVTAGDHDLVIGEVVHFESSPGEPLIFHRGAFGGLDEDALVPRGRVIGIADGEGWM